MSGGSRRLHDEGSHTSSSRHPLDDSSLFPSHSNKLPQSLTSEYHTLPFEQGQETRLTKGQRIEARDLDRKSPLPSVIYPPIPLEIRPDFRESKDNKDSHIESRETKEERREIYAESRMDFKGDIDRIKEVKSDRDAHTKFNVESETEKGKHVTLDSHLTRNESKEVPKVKRQPELPFEGLDQWRTINNLHTSEAAGKDTSTSDKREFQEGYRFLAESKVDMKGEERLKERDRKRKEEKHKDGGEREKDRNDYGCNLQAIGTNNDPRDTMKEQREIERPEKDIKNGFKDKERSIDGEREQNKREISNASDREIMRNNKVMVVASVKMSGQESPSSEQKRGKDVDGWKGNEKDGRDKKRDRDFDGEIEKHEKQGKAYEKDLDDGRVEGGGSEKDKETPGYGVQQRRRMLRPRGNPQVAIREPCFRTRARDNEGCQGKSEVSSVIYKVGECMQELIKLWTEFELSKDKAAATDNPHNGPILEIRIPAEHVAATNRQVRGGQLWGTDVYTYDSDLVAVLMHTGYCRPTASPPPPAIQELHATVRVLPPQDCYISTLRNNVRSRSWGAAIGCSFKIERCCIVKKGGGSIDLEPCLNHISAVEPTLAPVSAERTMTTRSAASNALRQQRFMREVTIQYNLCNEPWIKYSISIVADKGLKKPLYTSARLKKGEVLYLETHSNRYELCFIGERTISNGTMEASHCQDVDPENSQNHNSHHVLDKNNADCDNIVDIFRWSRCKTPLPQLVMRSIGIPLPVEHLEVLSDHLDWEDVQWTQTGLWVAGKEYQLARVHFLS